MAYFWLLNKKAAAVFSPSSLRAASSVSSSLPGEFELELASDDGGDEDAAATTAVRGADEPLCGHIAVLGRRRRIHTAVGAAAGELRPSNCILSHHQRNQIESVLRTKEKLEFGGD
jgi:hypothetical protein